MIIITQSTQCRSNASVDVCIVRQQALLVCVVKVSAVIDGGLLGRGTAEDFRSPGVEVRVEMNNTNWAVRFVDGAEEGQRDGVVAAEGDDAWECFLSEGGAGEGGGGHGCSHQEGIVAIFDLLDCVGVVVTSR